MKQPFVSIITPVYNEELFLEECIRSVLSQTYSNWEYIIVNNCSTDNSRDIALKYAQTDSRVRFIDNKTFLSQDDNLNHSLNQISSNSTYVKMVLGDDWIYPECIEKMVDIGEKCSNVGIISSYRLENDKVSCFGLYHNKSCFSGRDVARNSLMEDLFVFGSPTTVLFRSNVVRARNPFFNVKSLNSDTEACYEILKKWDFGFVHQVLSFTRRGNESVLSRRMKFSPFLLSKYICIKKYGPYYLSSSEYQQSLKKNVSRYYESLARSSIKPGRKDLLKYHEEGLRSINESIDHVLILKYLFLLILDYLLNPKNTIEILLKHIKFYHNP